MTSPYARSPAPTHLSPSTKARSSWSSTSLPSAASLRSTKASKPSISKYRDQGFVIAGFSQPTTSPAQEPGTNEEIQSFCTTNFAVDFPLYDKITVVGANKHPLYASLIDAQPKAISTGSVPFEEDLKKYGISPNAAPELLWNFEKFLVSRSGDVVAAFRA